MESTADFFFDWVQKRTVKITNIDSNVRHVTNKHRIHNQVCGKTITLGKNGDRSFENFFNLRQAWNLQLSHPTTKRCRRRRQAWNAQPSANHPWRRSQCDQMGENKGIFFTNILVTLEEKNLPITFFNSLFNKTNTCLMKM